MRFHHLLLMGPREKEKRRTRMLRWLWIRRCVGQRVWTSWVRREGLRREPCFFQTSVTRHVYDQISVVSSEVCDRRSCRLRYSSPSARVRLSSGLAARQFVFVVQMTIMALRPCSLASYRPKKPLNDCIGMKLLPVTPSRNNADIACLMPSL